MSDLRPHRPRGRPARARARRRARFLGRSDASAGWTRAVLSLAGRVADVSLAGAVGPALLLEPREVVDVLAGPVLLVATLVMIAVVVARAITDDRAVRRTVRVTNNAHAVGLALAVATLHLAEIEGLRAVMLAYGGLTQAAPTLVALGARRFGSGAAGGAVIATG